MPGRLARRRAAIPPCSPSAATSKHREPALLARLRLRRAIQGSRRERRSEDRSETRARRPSAVNRCEDREDPAALPGLKLRMAMAVGGTARAPVVWFIA